VTEFQECTHCHFRVSVEIQC